MFLLRLFNNIKNQEVYEKVVAKQNITEASFCRLARADTTAFRFGRSRASYAKHLDANRTISVPSELDTWPSKQESINTEIFLPLIRSRAYSKMKRN
jgi:hypothetical protein